MGDVDISVKNFIKLRSVFAQLFSQMPEFHLSKKGKNVIVLMLDRAMGEQIPYLFDEKPELKEQFAGFTYYANTILNQ